MRAVFFIAHKTADGGRVGIKEIAVGIDSPEHFLEGFTESKQARCDPIGERPKWWLLHGCNRTSAADQRRGGGGGWQRYFYRMRFGFKTMLRGQSLSFAP